MQIIRFKTQYLLTTMAIIVGLLAWVLSSSRVATAEMYTDSAHGNTSYGVNRSTAACENWPGGICSTGSCAHCHDTFDPAICGVNEDMLFFYPLDGAGGDEDFCMKCHTDSGSLQVGGMSGAPGNIAAVFQKTYGHDVTGYYGLHEFSPQDEDRTYLSANKHVECNDCHTPHLAEDGLHSSNEVHVAAGTNEISDSGPLKGAFGVEPTWSLSNWGGAYSWPSTSSTATKEYEICFKCHSDYNTNFSSWGGSGTESWTNVSLEFNPSNNSYHPVVQALPEDDPSYSIEYYPVHVYDEAHSNRLPPAFTSVLIGDSGLSAYASGGRIDIDPDEGNGKRWLEDEWINWGVRVGTLTSNGSSTLNQVGRITDNTSTQLTVSWQSIAGLSTGTFENDVVYSIEYYAGKGSRSGNRVTDTYKNFNLYLPSLAGYVVVITDTAGNNVAQGTVTTNTSAYFDVGGWTIVKGTSIPSGTVGYYFSATGRPMMCSDCHSNDRISDTAAQGPHGSAVKWMLKGRNKAWPTLSQADNGTGTGTLRKLGMRTLTNHRAIKDGHPSGDGLFCLNCHSIVGFSKNKYGVQDPSNVHIPHAANWPQGPECVRCHIMVPHGGKLSRLIGDRDGGMPARYAFNNDLTNMWVTQYSKCLDPAGYDDTTGRGNDWCSVHCHGMCGYHHPCADNGHNW